MMDMEINVLKDDKDFLEIEIKGEGHTLCNLLRKQISNEENTKFSSYQIKHPLVSQPILNVKADNPRKAVLRAVDSSLKLIKEFRSELKKL